MTMGTFSLLMIKCLHFIGKKNIISRALWLSLFCLFSVSCLGLPWFRNISCLNKISFYFMFQLFFTLDNILTLSGPVTLLKTPRKSHRNRTLWRLFVTTSTIVCLVKMSAGVLNKCREMLRGMIFLFRFSLFCGWFLKSCKWIRL